MFPKDTHILIADDSEPVLTLLREQLTKLGYENILEADNGKNVIQQLDLLQKAQVNPILMIIDWNMPEMTGIEVLQSVRSNPATKSIPFLMITSESETEKVIKAIVLGVSDFIVKPFDEHLLSDKMTSVWKRVSGEKPPKS